MNASPRLLRFLAALSLLSALSACQSVSTSQPAAVAAPPAAAPAETAERAAPPPPAAEPEAAMRTPATAAAARSTGAPAGVAEQPGARGWWATSWTATDGQGFLGKPVSQTRNAATTIVIRYTRFTTDYDTPFHSPVWGAYTVDRTTVENDLSGRRTASNPDFARPSQFTPDPLVVALSRRLNVPHATHQTFGDSVDPRYPVTPASLSAQQALAQPSIIQRGHMVPNNALKCAGTYAEGQVAQRETFSIANIVPQMKLSNAPTWSALESACLDWAHELGQVWVFVGPIYHDKARPVMTEKRTTHEKLIVPSPDELYYVIIGRRGNQTSAVAFKLPHRPELLDFKRYAVPVDDVERATGLNFMPDLGEPCALERAYDPAWLQTPPRRADTANDDV